ncbi:aspartate kinase [Natranaerofaba carboxydovora]|uniref:aspartate kinase n=1 Tax=Natranaerofaba carboxydovora TaxID=2742683 RepID=UPI001F13F7B4|nr:aspartate kinase [Natranaerofaba carboxydovora]UMZ74883.1 Aspartate kinase [Natranaerofaba carboxydovora]
MSVVVMKFGGSSVKDKDRIMNVAEKIVKRKKSGDDVVVVVSAMGDSTDELIELAQDINPNPPDREWDMLLSTGEQVSSALLTMAINTYGVPAISLNAAQVGIKTDDVHKKARILSIDDKRLNKELKEGNVVIVTGFQGVNGGFDITTLGRGGSDTSAVALAKALEADLCEIYTDVDGVYTADPRIVKDARKLTSITYDEMLELSSLGSKVLQARSVECARLHNITIHVRSSFNDKEGTYVQEGRENMEIKNPLIRGVCSDKDIAKVAVKGVPDKPGVSYKIFSELARVNIHVDMIVQSIQKEKGINDILFTVKLEDVTKAKEVLESIDEFEVEDIMIKEDVAKVSIVGAGISQNPEVYPAMFGALGKEDINIEIISTSETRISCLIDEKRLEKAIEAIHDKFELGNEDRGEDTSVSLGG